MKYYNKATKNETFASQLHLNEVVELPDSNPFFSPLPKGKMLTYDSNNIPNGLEDIPIVPPTKEQQAEVIKKQRDLDMAIVTVDHDSKSWSFGIVDMSRFESKIARNRDFQWKSDDGTINTLTNAQAEDIAKKADDKITQIFFDAETEIGNL